MDFGKRVTCTISRNGDLIHRMYLQVTLPEVTPASNQDFRWVDYVGLAMIKSVEIEIGGQKIDKHYGEWMYIWNELSQTAGKKDGYNKMIGHDLALTQEITGTGTLGAEKKTARTLFVPLEFWFCRNPGLALPLIALNSGLKSVLPVPICA